MRVSVLGSGSWGTALAVIARQNAITTLWTRKAESAEQLRADNENKNYLAGVRLDDIQITSDLQKAIEGQDLLILAIPMAFLKSFVGRIEDYLVEGQRLMCVSKGMSMMEQQFASEIVEGECRNKNPIVILSGPSHAEEVARYHPVNVVVASKRVDESLWVQTNFSTDCFRIYTNDDVLGVEIGGAVKNIIAIAAGIAEGLGFGSSTIAALVSRGMAEIIRFGRAFGAQEKTFYGLSGLGDLIATCTSQYSRNRFVGEQLVLGKSWDEIQATMKMVAEGVYTTKSVLDYAQKKQIEMPITKAVYSVLFQDVPPKEALSKLMNRDLKSE